ncbi:MAG: hypothetical protein ACI352_02895 [Elusimicrobiaceae bacterium]
MKHLLLAVLISFVCANAYAASAPKPETLKLNMKMTAATQPKQKAKTVEFLSYAQFTTGPIKVQPKLKFAGKKAVVHFFKMDDALAFAYEENSKFDKIEVKLSAKDEDLFNGDPHHVVPVYADITVYKNNKIAEKGSLEVFSVELYEIWSANRPVEINRGGSSFRGDPHDPENYAPVENNKKNDKSNPDPYHPTFFD